MKKFYLIAVSTFFLISSHAQKIYEQYTRVADSLRYGYGKEEVFPCGSKGFTLVMPASPRQAATWDLVDKSELIGWMKAQSE